MRQGTVPRSGSAGCKVPLDQLCSPRAGSYRCSTQNGLNGGINWYATSAPPAAKHNARFTAGPPTVTINQASGQTDPSSTASITFTVQFSEPVTGFAASDILFTGSTATGTLVANITGSGPLYTVTVTGMTGTGNVVVIIPAGAATDSEANPSAASTSTDNTVNWIKP